MQNVRWFLVLLCAGCSAGTNQDMSLTRATARRDAAADAVSPQDEEAATGEAEDAGDQPEPEEDAAPEPDDAAAPEQDAQGGGLLDAGLDVGLDAGFDAGPDAETLDASDAALMDAADAAAADSASPTDAAADAADGDADDAGVSRVLITFEGITAMANSQVAVPQAARLSDGYRPTTGAVFSSNAPFVAVVSLGQGHANSGVNGIGGTNSDGYLAYATPIRVTFMAPHDGSVPATTHFVKLRGDHAPASGVATMIAYDLDGTEIGRAQANDTSAGLTLQLELAGIHAVVVSQTQANIAFDDLEFAPVIPQ
jgi:hypothetical protein